MSAVTGSTEQAIIDETLAAAGFELVKGIGAETLVKKHGKFVIDDEGIPISFGNAQSAIRWCLA